MNVIKSSTRASRGPVALAAAAALAWAPAVAQAPSQPVPKVSFRYEQALPAKAPAPRGLIVRVELAEGWHINSEAPLDSFLVPTALEAQAEGLAFGKPKFPEPVKQYSQVMGGDMSLYTGTFEVAVPVSKQPASGAPAAKGPPHPRTRVSFRYQSCNNSMCLPPKTIIAEDYGGLPAQTRVVNQ
jgi:hypothetical protein